MRDRTYDRLQRLHPANLGTAEYLDQAATLLASALPHDSGCWHTTDPDSLVETGYRAHNMPPPDAEVARFAYLPEDFNSFARLTAGRRHSGILSEATGGRLDRSVRYRELLRANGMTGELRAALVVDGVCWGNVSLFRAAPHDFTVEERDFLHDLTALLGRGLRAAGVLARTVGAVRTRWPGVLVFGRAGGLVTRSDPARSWLADLGADGETMPFSVLALVERARAEGVAAARVRSGAGDWVALHASAADDQVAVVLQSAHPDSVAPLLYAAFGLTSRERDVVDLVIQGCSTGEIGDRLFISPLTVQAHLTSVFGKTGVRSRRQLTGLVSGRALS